MKIKQIYKLFILFFLVAIVTVSCQSYSSELSVPENCRTIQHEAGETCVSISPKRVVVLNHALFANAIALGVRPVGTVTQPALSASEVPPYLEGKVDDSIASVGISQQPSLEKIVQLQPDLIVDYSYDNNYDRLSQIAPTVIIEWKEAGHWKEHLKMMGRALGKTETADRLLAEYDRRIDRLNAAIESPEELEISLAYIGGNAPFARSDVKNSFPGSILEDAGLSRPPSQDIVHDGYQIEVGPEMIPSLDGDVLFLFSVDDEQGRETWKRLQSHPIWQQLDVVRNDRVYLVDFGTWRMTNILAAHGIVDDLFEHLVEENNSDKLSEKQSSSK